MKSTEEHLKSLRDAIQKNSFIRMAIHDASPSYVFTIGLYHSYKHPEILMFIPGMKSQTANPGLFKANSLSDVSESSAVKTLVNAVQKIGENVKNGIEYQDGEKYPDIFPNDYLVLFQSVDKQYYDEYLGAAVGFYGNNSFPVLQCLLLDKHGLFPTAPGCDKATANGQKLRLKLW